MDPDLILRVKQTRVDGQKALNFELKARDPRLRLNFAEFNSRPFQADEQKFFQQLFLDLAQIPEDHAETKLAGRGALLCTELLPVELRRRLWKLIGRVRTVQIISDEVWIPWEILRLHDPDKPSSPGRFLVESFNLTRGILIDSARPQVVLKLPMRRIGLVIPRDSGLPSASLEAERIRALGGPFRQVDEIPATYQKLKEALATSRYECLHFAGHGRAREGSPHQWCIVLERKEKVEPADLYEFARGLGHGQPLVFLNACHSGRGAVSLTGMAGLARAFLEAGAGAFLGAHWALEDEQACRFSEEFYKHLFAGEEIGEAVMRARLRLRKEFPGSNDWLAYTLFAHPLASCPVKKASRPVPVKTLKPGYGAIQIAEPRPEPVKHREEPVEPEKPATPTPGEVLLHPKDGSLLVYVPGGDFLLGAEDLPLSRPVRRVRLSPFWIGRFPVTNEQYARYLAENPSRPEPAYWEDPRFNQPGLPVVGVSWEEARAYCDWAGVDLPSEVQWEAAARGADQRPFPWGRELPTPGHANFSGTGTAPVDAHPAGAGPYGTFSQSGNVWEWCADPWACDAFRQFKEGQCDPVVPEGEDAIRPLRGGSWINPAKELRAALRERGTARRRLNTQGFRCVWRPV